MILWLVVRQVAYFLVTCVVFYVLYTICWRLKFFFLIIFHYTRAAQKVTLTWLTCLKKYLIIYEYILKLQLFNHLKYDLKNINYAFKFWEIKIANILDVTCILLIKQRVQGLNLFTHSRNKVKKNNVLFSHVQLASVRGTFPLYSTKCSFSLAHSGITAIVKE